MRLSLALTAPPCCRSRGVLVLSTASIFQTALGLSIRTSWQRLEKTLTEFYNYKGDHRIVLMSIVEILLTNTVIVDGNCNFICVSIDCQGRIPDGGVFRNTKFSKILENGTLKLPRDEPLPGRENPILYVLVAVVAFPFETFLY